MELLIGVVGITSIKKILKKNDIVLILVPEKSYSKKIKQIARDVSSSSKSVCYLTLNKPYPALSREFRKGKIDLNRFFFIDALSKDSKEDQVVTVSSPKALTEINIVMKKVIKAGKIKATIIDSISTLLVYEGSSQVLRFTHSIVSLFRSLGSKGIIIALKHDMKNEVIRDIGMFVDKVVGPG